MADDDSFASPETALAHYRTLCASLEQQLNDANADIQEYTESSKELQDELEKELARMEKSERGMRKDLEEAKGECEDWKSRYTATLREHTNTMTHMQRELESLRASEKDIRTKLRDMELDNDDLEKSEREKDSSLQDLENRYGKSIERIALLEEELVNKAQLEEEVQRLKDELRDLHEELSVTRSQATTSYARPLTPPSGTSAHALSNASSSPSRAGAEEDVFATPRKPTAADSPAPSIELVNPTPLPMRSPPAPKRQPSSPPPPLPPFPASHSSRSVLAASTLARSTKTRNLSSAAPSTPKAIRESRVNGTIQDMKLMTDRVKQLTSRLDSRRNLVMAGSSIPRASMSPGSLARSTTSRRLAPGASSLGKSVGPSRTSGETNGVRSSSRAGSRAGSEIGEILVGSTRPSSRSAMRQSIGGGGRTSIPVRPSSRLSTFSGASSSRPATPSLPSGRSPTPTSSRSSSSLSNRPPWGSTAATQQSALGVSTRGPSSGLATSTRRRASTALPEPALSKSTRAGLGVSTNRYSTEIPVPRRPVSRNSTRESETLMAPPRSSAAGGSLSKSTVGADRRASFGLGLGKSILGSRKGSAQ